MSTNANPSVIVAGARTPIGRLLGGLKGLSAAELGGVAIKGALDKAGVSGDQVDYLIMGQVIQAGAGQNPARTAGVAAGLPMSLPSITINKVCLSGVNAIATADALIRAGVHNIVVAGGMESMTNAPHVLPKSREGFKYGDVALVDSMAYDALYDQITQQAMGGLTESCNADGTNLSREEQDTFAARSHQLAAAAWKNGVFDDRVVPVEIPQRKGDPIVISEDEGIRGETTVESARQAPPGLLQGRHHHRRLGLADLRRRLRRGRDEQGQGRGARPGVAVRDRCLRSGGRPPVHPAAAARQRHREGAGEGRHQHRGRRPRRVQRGLRRGRHRVGARARHPPGQGQRQRRRDRPGAPRWASPAPGSCCTWRWSSSVAVEGPVSLPCVVAAARAMPSSSRCPPPEPAPPRPGRWPAMSRRTKDRSRSWSRRPAPGTPARWPG